MKKGPRAKKLVFDERWPGLYYIHVLWASKEQLAGLFKHAPYYAAHVYIEFDSAGRTVPRLCWSERALR